MTRLDIPECSIQTFERIHNLNVTVHDFSGSLGSFLKPNRFHHRSPLCLAVKGQGHHAKCLQFEIESLPRELARLPEGRMHVCHAGFAEWVAPVFEKEKLSWILFAGPRRPGQALSSAVLAQRTRWLKYPWAKSLALPPPVEEAEGLLIMEHLLQLAARLQNWTHELKAGRSVENEAGEFPSKLAVRRQTAVIRFIEDRYAESVILAMLAGKLGLSESRASHVVQSCCGSNFRELLIQKRLAVAMDLLRKSGMSVLEVALASGFEDVAHFHRLFRRRIGTPPGRFRVSGHT